MNLLLFILALTALSAAVSFVVAFFIRSFVLAVIGSSIISELLLILYGLVQATQSREGYDFLLGVALAAMVSAPIFLVSSNIFTFMAYQIFQKRNQK